MFIYNELYDNIRRVLPILCVDVMVRYNGRYLLIKRTEEPMKDVFWVIGGRVNKGEDLKRAALRKMREEIGLEPFEIEMVGVYEDVYEYCSSGAVEGGYHTVSVVFEAFVDSLDGLTLDDTSVEWGMFCSPPRRFKVKGFYNNDQN